MRARIRNGIAIASLLWALAAHAQVLPQVKLPGVQLPVDSALRGVDDAVQRLPTRALRSQQLFEQHRAELDRDAAGELVVRAEVVAIDISDLALGKARKADFLVKRVQELPDLGVKITVLQTPEGMSARRGLAKLRKLDPEGTYDYNHVYLDSGDPVAPAAASPSAAPPGPGASGVRVGMIDGGVDTNHEALRANPVRESGCDGRHVPSDHGTAVASLLGGVSTTFHGVAPNAQLFVADVYCGSPTGGAVDAVAAAFGWMAREKVAVINVSLVGPRNVLLERVVSVLVARGFLIVAAVGNDGPAAAPLFPAAYAGVVGVTAVDGKHKVLLEACRGKHLAFAAPGADLTAARNGSAADYVAVRGTSFAAPIVAGMLAVRLHEPDPTAAQHALATLSALAIDLGSKGRDDTYGTGFVGDGAVLTPAPGKPNK